MEEGPVSSEKKVLCSPHVMSLGSLTYLIAHKFSFFFLWGPANNILRGPCQQLLTLLMRKSASVLSVNVNDQVQNIGNANSNSYLLALYQLNNSQIYTMRNNHASYKIMPNCISQLNNISAVIKQCDFASSVNKINWNF